MHASQRFSDTFPDGLAGLAGTVFDSRRRNAGGYELLPERLPMLNDALHRISPQAPSVQIDQMATAARRVLSRYPMGTRPAFVDSRMRAMTHLQQLADDEGWNPDPSVHECVAVLRAYLDNPDDLLPDHLPSIGLLDDALLVDLALQTLRDELADYEDFCQFRHVAADFARVGDADTGLTRGQWQQALHQARGSSQWQGDGVLQFPHNNGDRLERNHGLRRGYVADPRVSLFHIS
jgi:hypothetical protein